MPKNTINSSKTSEGKYFDWVDVFQVLIFLALGGDGEGGDGAVTPIVLFRTVAQGTVVL